MTRAATLTFLGAARTVTGSRFLIESGGNQLLVDCGLFQGDRDWRRRNWDPLPFDPADADAVVLTHAHLDHSGFLPVLARSGFSGPILCTRTTAELAALVLRDAAHLQEEETRWARASRLSRHEHPRPLYDTADAERAISLLRPVSRDRPTPVGDSIQVVLHRAGHILGSSFAAVRCGSSRIVFSGDLGRPDHPLLTAPDPVGPADHLIIESTYGSREHDRTGSEQLAEVLARTCDRGGVALLPAFAVDRTAMLLYEIRELIGRDLVPDVPVYVDSPMALAALRIYRTALQKGDRDFRPSLLRADHDPFDPGRLRLVHGPVESAKLNDPNHPCIVISASGMATGGRVLHHLEHQLPRARNSVVLTGFQVAGTRGRALVDGASAIKIRGRYIPVRAEVANITGFSAHADAGQLLSWARDASPRTAFVVHGEPRSAETLAHAFTADLGWTAVVPSFMERVVIG